MPPMPSALKSPHVKGRHFRWRADAVAAPCLLYCGVYTFATGAVTIDEGYET